ncbi:hypothetical protein BKA83DRAFT_4132528 [Pisolithus microcarpus]|nr:hypothetical protein BKA83DRAFT_4132528 [Pisolithus microcarpus]
MWHACNRCWQPQAVCVSSPLPPPAPSTPVAYRPVDPLSNHYHTDNIVPSSFGCCPALVTFSGQVAWCLVGHPLPTSHQYHSSMMPVDFGSHFLHFEPFLGQISGPGACFWFAFFAFLSPSLVTSLAQVPRCLGLGLALLGFLGAFDTCFVLVVEFISTCLLVAEASLRLGPLSSPQSRDVFGGACKGQVGSLLLAVAIQSVLGFLPFALLIVEFQSTPPTSPQLAHNAGRQAERDQRVLGSPPSRRQPHHPAPPLIVHPPVPLHQYSGIPPPQPPPLPAPLPPQMVPFPPPYYQNFAPPAPPPQSVPQHVDYTARLLEGFNNDHGRRRQQRRNQRANNISTAAPAHAGPSHAPPPPNYHTYQQVSNLQHEAEEWRNQQAQQQHAQHLQAMQVQQLQEWQHLQSMRVRQQQQQGQEWEHLQSMRVQQQQQQGQEWGNLQSMRVQQQQQQGQEWGNLQSMRVQQQQQQGQEWGNLQSMRVQQQQQQGQEWGNLQSMRVQQQQQQGQEWGNLQSMRVQQQQQQGQEWGNLQSMRVQQQQQQGQEWGNLQSMRVQQQQQQGQEWGNLQSIRCSSSRGKGRSGSTFKT